jgi:RND family efflux transporter MFP subunit
MNRPKPAVPLLVLSAALLLSAGCGRRHEAAAPPAEPAPVSAPVAVAEIAAAPATIEVTGTVEPIERVSPGTKLMGRVERVYVGEGDAVRKGQVLARLESRDLAAAVEQARAGVAMAEAQLANAEAMHRRMTALAERGSATAKNLEDATAGYNMARAGLQQAQASLSAARVMMDYAVITTPIAGFVTAKRVEAGDMAAPGMPLFTIDDMSRSKIVAAVPEAQVVGLVEGGPATVRIDVLETPVSATIDRIVPAGESMSRTFSVQLLIENPGVTIKPGMYARIWFPAGTAQSLTVPRAALVERGQLQGLWVLDAQGKARLRWVRLGAATGDRVEVLSGLAEGERYIAAPPPGIVDGAPVSGAASSSTSSSGPAR